MPAFSKLKRFSWNGIEFPVSRCSVKGSMRHHVHVYPHAWGGAYEKLERALYEIHVTAPMMATFPKYPDLWPKKWSQMRQQFEKGDAGKLHIATIGTIDARCTAWPEEMDAKRQSGVMVELDFLEDQSQQFLADKLIDTAKATIAQSTTVASAEWEAAKAAYLNGVSGYEQNLFDKILGAANDLFALKDRGLMYASILEAKIRALDAMIQEADATIRLLNDPLGCPVLQALRDIWQSSYDLSVDLAQQHQTMQTYVVPMVMSVADISTALYGDNSQAVTLLQSNPIVDAFAVPAGTKIRYYPGLE